MKYMKVNNNKVESDVECRLWIFSFLEEIIKHFLLNSQSHIDVFEYFIDINLCLKR